MERVRLTDMAQALNVHVDGAAGVEVVGAFDRLENGAPW